MSESKAGRINIRGRAFQTQLVGGTVTAERLEVLHEFAMSLDSTKRIQGRLRPRRSQQAEPKLESTPCRGDQLLSCSNGARIQLGEVLREARVQMNSNGREHSMGLFANAREKCESNV
jgi:hypothetical protein